jgi:hypothetical protein
MKETAAIRNKGITLADGVSVSDGVAKTMRVGSIFGVVICLVSPCFALKSTGGNILVGAMNIGCIGEGYC